MDKGYCADVKLSILLLSVWGGVSNNYEMTEAHYIIFGVAFLVLHHW